MIEWNTVKYIDCMDKDEGLPSLLDKSIDYAILDPPFNINLKHGPTIKKSAVLYDDNRMDYKEWCMIWFKELKRICNTIGIYVGQTEDMWIEIEKPMGKAYLNKPNSKSGARISKLKRIYPILFYGKLQKRLKKDYFYYWATSGFLRKYNFIHPCPLIIGFWHDLIKQLQPKSVIDPFLGSGTTAEVCTKLGIKWIGYEINEVYSHDINMRLKNCKKEPQTVELEKWL